MRLFFQAPAWRLKKPLAELMPGKARLFPAALFAARNTREQRFPLETVGKF